MKDDTKIMIGIMFFIALSVGAAVSVMFSYGVG